MSKKNTLVTSQFLTPAAPSQGVKVMDRDEFGPVFTGPGLSSAERKIGRASCRERVYVLV